MKTTKILISATLFYSSLFSMDLVEVKENVTKNKNAVEFLIEDNKKMEQEIKSLKLKLLRLEKSNKIVKTTKSFLVLNDLTKIISTNTKQTVGFYLQGDTLKGSYSDDRKWIITKRGLIDSTDVELITKEK